ncbi:hypothetical protein BDV95DRAFT_484703 [Massariosphaeria phaeospora]|uniref:Uncharacterized protein n=1 Tax=Massariosphaeria phaeospora TaxID=100035 RepID=A0A7C8ILF0_9PLEO|nr:hypothetical protein BDV95DRAFT_484703 [Massariosphaeria phaeospora]
MTQLPKDIRLWSKSSRKALLAAGFFTLHVGNVAYRAPKLALLVVSTELRGFINADPIKCEVKLVHNGTHAESVNLIAAWLTSTCHTELRVTPKLMAPTDLEAMLKLRQTAQTLGMDHYVDHFSHAYHQRLRHRVPAPVELTLVENNTSNDDDKILCALANRVGYLRRTGQLSASFLEGLNNWLADPAHERFCKAIKAADERHELSKATKGQFVVKHQ